MEMEDFESIEALEPQVIQTEDEDGNLHNFELIDIVEVDDQEYGILLYLDENEEESQESEEEELALMRLIKKDESYIFETIDDEEEFKKVSALVEAELNAECESEEK